MLSPRTRRGLEGYGFIAPWLLGFLGLTAGPIGYSIWISFQRWNVLTPAKYVGVANYRKLFTDDPLFWKSLGNTAYYAFGSVPIQLFLAMGLAILLNQQVKGLSIFRTIFYLPSIMSGVATAMLWTLLLNADIGGINFLLRSLGMSNPPGWLNSTTWAMPALILMSTWSIGTMMLIFLAGLQGVPESLYDAANVDGANAFTRFRHVTLPLMTPTLFFNLVMAIIGSFQIFTQTFIMTGGGPANATLTYVLYLYRNAFEWFKMGYASALAWVLFAIILTMTAMVFKSSALWVYYESERA